MIPSNISEWVIFLSGSLVGSIFTGLVLCFIAGRHNRSLRGKKQERRPLSVLLKL